MGKFAIKAVILDADGTLIAGNSWSSITKNLGGSLEEHARILKDFQGGRLEVESAIEAIINIWTKNGPVNKDKLEEIFTRMPLADYAVEVCEYLKNKYKAAIISGSLDLNIKLLARRLGIQTWKSNSRLVFDKEQNLKTFIYYKDEAQRKSDLFDEFLSENGIKPEECAVIGDGDSDRVLFGRAGLAILIPSPMTRPDLTEQVDLVLKDLKEVKNFL